MLVNQFDHPDHVSSLKSKEHTYILEDMAAVDPENGLESIILILYPLFHFFLFACIPVTMSLSARRRQNKTTIVTILVLGTQMESGVHL